MAKKQRVQISRMNWDIEYLNDIISNNGFLISEPAIFQVDESKQKSLYGARSTLYGTNYDDENAFIERYRCHCGSFTGRVFEGEVCPICKHKVEYKDVNIKFTGWISLSGNYIINPFYYQKLCDILGKNTVPEIINRRTVVDLNGNLSRATEEDLGEKPKHPYVGLGLIEFKERFHEVMLYFRDKKKKGKKVSEIDRIIYESSSVFCSYIPIYSTLLRPQSSTTDTYYFNTIDKQINPIFSLSEKLKNCEEIDKHIILSRIQYRVNTLWNENFKLLNGKEGLIRGQILGGSVKCWLSLNLFNCWELLLGHQYQSVTI